MTKLIYRGHEVKDAPEVRQSLADQMRKPHLVYRGVAHDGTHPAEPAQRERRLIYRGHRFA